MAYEVYHGNDVQVRQQITAHLRALAALIGSGMGGREVLTAHRTYYVRTDGSDSNTGLANTAGGAFLTIQHAVDLASEIEFNGWDVEIYVADGTYNAGGWTSYACLPSGGGLYLYGNTTTPANCIISMTGTPFNVNGNGASMYISGFKVISSLSSAIIVSTGAFVETGNMEYGACAAGYHLWAYEGGRIYRNGNCTISGAALAHMRVQGNGAISGVGGRTITLTGTPAFSEAFASASENSLIDDLSTYGGSATGKRYISTGNSMIDVHGGGINYFPGDVAGTWTFGGQYDTNATNADTVTTNANLTGHVTSTGNAAVLGSFTKAQLDTAVSDGNVLYVGDVTTNATHTGEVTGSGALTVDKTAISNRSTVTVAATDTILIGDASDSNNLAKIAASDFVASASLGTNVATFLATPSSANLAAALTDESNSGVVPFLTSGTFTPTIQDSSLSDSESQTYTTQVGWYRRIGDVVFIWIGIEINSLGTLTGGDTVRIAGLPFTNNATISGSLPVSVGSSLAITAGNALVGQIGTSANYILLNKWSATTGTSGVTITQLSTGGLLVLSGCYVV